jgi:chromosome segregation ATPase
MDENDFKRLLNESAAETRRDLKHLLEETSAETHRRIDANAAETQQRFAQMERRFDGIEARIDANAAGTQQRFDEVDARFAETNARFDHVDARAAELKQHIDKTAAQVKLHFDLTVEDMRTDVQRVADGVLMVNEKLDREAADIRAEMRQGFADTQAMLRHSHNDLDRRVTVLERAAK